MKFDFEKLAKLGTVIASLATILNAGNLDNIKISIDNTPIDKNNTIVSIYANKLNGLKNYTGEQELKKAKILKEQMEISIYGTLRHMKRFMKNPENYSEIGNHEEALKSIVKVENLLKLYGELKEKHPELFTKVDYLKNKDKIIELLKQFKEYVITHRNEIDQKVESESVQIQLPENFSSY